MNQEIIEISNVLNTYPKYKNKLPVKILIGLLIHHSLLVILTGGLIMILIVFYKNFFNNDISYLISLAFVIILIKKVKDFNRIYKYLKEYRKINTYISSYKDYCYIIDDIHKTYNQYEWFENNILKINKINYLEPKITHVEKTQRPQLEEFQFFK